MSTTINPIEGNRDRAIALLFEYANLYKYEIYLYEIVCSPDDAPLNKDYLLHDGSCTSYCKNCIDHAVRQARKEWIKEVEDKYSRFNKIVADGFYIQDGKEITPAADAIKAHRIYLRKSYRKGKIFGYQCYDVSSSEHDGFELCDGCGVIFSQGLLLSEQEVEHWEGLEFSIPILKEPYEAYQLVKVLEENYRYTERLDALALKVINTFNSPPPTQQ